MIAAVRRGAELVSVHTLITAQPGTGGPAQPAQPRPARPAQPSQPRKVVRLDQELWRQTFMGREN